MYHQHHAATRAVLTRIQPALHAIHLPPSHPALPAHPTRHVAPRVASAHRRQALMPSPIVERVRHEYQEWPTLSLTTRQAGRLFGLGEEACTRVLQSFVRTGFLLRMPDGQFCRREPLH